MMDLKQLYLNVHRVHLEYIYCTSFLFCGYHINIKLIAEKFHGESEELL